MEENIGLLFEELGGEEKFGSLDVFKSIAQDEDNKELFFEEMGGAESFGSRKSFDEVFGLTPAQEDVPKADPRDEEFKQVSGFGGHPIERDLLKLAEHLGEGEAGEQSEAGDKELSNISQLASLIDPSFYINNIKLGYISGRLGNINEVSDNVSGNIDDDYIDNMLYYRKWQRDVTNDLESTRGSNKNAGRWLTDVVGSVVSSVIGMGVEAGSDIVEAVQDPLSGETLEAGGQVLAMFNPASSFITMGLSGADTEAGSIFSKKIDDYAAENGIDAYTREGLAEVLSDEEFVEEARKLSVVGGAIVGLAEGLSGKFGGKLAKKMMGKNYTENLFEITSLGQVGTNFMGRHASGAAFDGTGELSKQLVTEGEVDLYELSLEMGSGTTTGLVTNVYQTAVGKNSEINAIGQNKLRDKLLEEGGLRPRSGDPSMDVTLTEEEVKQAERQAKIEAGIDPDAELDENGVVVKFGEVLEGVTPEELKAATESISRISRGRINPLRETFVDAVADGKNKEIADVTQHMVDNKILSESARKEMLEATTDISEFVSQIPQEVRSEKPALAREMLQVFLDIRTQEEVVVMAEKQAKADKKGLFKNPKNKLKREKNKLSKLESFLSNLAEQNEMSFEDYNTKTEVLRLAQLNNSNNFRPPRNSIEVVGNEAVILNENERTSLTQAVEELNKKRDNRLKLVEPAPVPDHTPFRLQIGTPVQEHEGRAGVFTLDSSKEGPIEVEYVEGQNKTKEDVNSDLGEVLFDLVERGEIAQMDEGSMTPNVKEYWDALVEQGRGEKAGNTYRMLSKEAAKENQERAIAEEISNLNADREVASVRNKELNKTEKKKQLKDSVKALQDAGLEVGEEAIVIVSDNDFKAMAPPGRENDVAYVEGLDTGNPRIVINESRRKNTTLPHEVAHVLIAQKSEVDGDLLNYFAENLKGVLANSNVPSERALLRTLNALVDKYAERGESTEVQAEEFLVELAAYLSINERRLARNPSLTRQILQAITKAISDILGYQTSVELDDVNDAIDFINDLADEVSGKKKSKTAPSTLAEIKESSINQPFDTPYDDHGYTGVVKTRREKGDTLEDIKAEPEESLSFAFTKNGNVRVFLTPEQKAEYLAEKARLKKRWGSTAGFYHRLDKLVADAREKDSDVVLDLRQGVFADPVVPGGVVLENQESSSSHPIDKPFDAHGYTDIVHTKREKGDPLNDIPATKAETITFSNSGGTVRMFVTPEQKRQYKKYYKDLENKYGKENVKNFLHPLDKLANEVRDSGVDTVLELRNGKIAEPEVETVPEGVKLDESGFEDVSAKAEVVVDPRAKPKKVSPKRSKKATNKEPVSDGVYEDFLKGKVSNRLLARLAEKYRTKSPLSPREKEIVVAKIKEISEINSVLSTTRVVSSKDKVSKKSRGVELEYEDREVNGKPTGDVEITNLWVATKQRGKKKARKALEALVDKMDKAGVPLVVNPVPKDSTTNERGLISFFQSLGFRKMGKGPLMSRGIGGVPYILPETSEVYDSTTGGDFMRTDPEAYVVSDADVTPDPTPSDLLKRLPKVGNIFYYEGGKMITTKVRGGTFDGRSVGRAGFYVKGITLSDSLYEGVDINDTRSQIDDDISDIEKAVIDRILNTREFSTEDKRRLLKEAGIEPHVIEQVISGVYVSNIRAKKPLAERNQETLANSQGSDTAFDTILTEQEKADGLFHIGGELITKAEMNAMALRMGLEVPTTDRERVSLAAMLKKAAMDGHLDTPGQIGSNSYKAVKAIFNRVAISEYEFIGVAETYGSILNRIEELTKLIEEDTSIVSINRMRLQNEKDQLLTMALVYQRAINISQSSSARKLAISKHFGEKFNAELDRKDFESKLTKLSDKSIKKLDKVYSRVKAAMDKMMSLGNSEREIAQRASNKRASDSILEIGRQPDAPLPYDVMEREFTFAKTTSQSTRSQISLMSEKEKEDLAAKYNSIYKVARQIISRGQASTLNELQTVIMTKYANLKGPLKPAFANLTPEDIRVAMELGFSGVRRKAKSDIQENLRAVRRFAKASQVVADLNAIVSDPSRVDPDVLAAFQKELHSYIKSLTQDGFKQLVPDENLSASLITLQNIINQYDTAVFHNNGTVDAAILNEISNNFKKAINLLGADVTANKVDVSELENAWQNKLTREAQGQITSTKLPPPALTVEQLQERAEAQEKISDAQYEFNYKMKELSLAKKRIAYENRIKNTGDSLEKFKLKVGKIKPWLFELPRQIIFSVDYSFIGVQAGINMMSMLPQTAIDTAIIARKGGDPTIPYKSLINFWKKSFNQMFGSKYFRFKEGSLKRRGNFLEKDNVLQAWADFRKDIYAKEMMSIQPDVFGDPTRTADSSSREEFVAFNLGDKLQDWAEDNRLGSVPLLSTATKVVSKVGVAGSYFSDTYTMFMNDLRLHQYKMFLATNPNATIDQKRKVIQGIMDFTGRGVADNPIAEFMTGPNASYVFSAPRLYLSNVKKIQNLFTSLASFTYTFGAKAGGLTLRETVIPPGAVKDKDGYYVKNKNGDYLDKNGNALSTPDGQGIDFASLELLKQYAAAGMGMATIIMMYSALGWDWEEDPKDRNFGKMRKGDQVLDVSAGLAQYVKIPAWAIYTGVKNSSQKTADEIFGEQTANQKVSLQQRTIAGDFSKFIQYKLHPTIGLALQGVTGQNAIGETLGVTIEDRSANVLKQVIPITGQAAFDAMDLGRTRLDKSRFNLEEFATIFGVGHIGYNNKLKDIRVIKYADELDWKNGKESKKGYPLSRIITKKTAEKYIVGNSNEKPYESIVDSNKKKAITDAFKAHAQDQLGIWLLGEIKAGRTPSKDAILAQSKRISKVLGKDYYEKVVRPNEWEWVE